MWKWGAQAWDCEGVGSGPSVDSVAINGEKLSSRSKGGG